MTLVSQIIQDGYRESNIVAVSADVSADQAAEGLRLLNRMVSSVYGDEAGDPLEPLLIGRNNISQPSGYPYYDPVPYSNNWFVPLNRQLVLNLDQPVEVWLSPQPQDGSRVSFIDKSLNLSTFPFTINGNGRTIENALQMVYNTDGQRADFMYRQDTGNWYRTTDLDFTDDMPFPMEYDDLWTTWLAKRLSPRYQQALDPETEKTFNRTVSAFRAKYHQVIPTPSELGLILTPGTQRTRYWGGTSATDLWNSGYPWPWPSF